jgi:hypothetical protein
VEGTVGDGYVGRIGLHADAIISVIDDPIIKCDMVTINSIGTIGVCCNAQAKR